VSISAEVAGLCTLAGITPDAWQQSVLDRVFAAGSNGKAAEFEVRASPRDRDAAARVALQCALGWLFLADERIALSARNSHEMTQLFSFLLRLINGNDFLQQRLARVSHRNGDAYIALRTGARVSFMSRARGAGRGSHAGKLIIDESMGLTDSQLMALLPFIAAAPDPQVLLTGVLDLGGGYCAVPR